MLVIDNIEALSPVGAPFDSNTGGSMKQLVLIDGHSLAYRMFFALERTGMKTSQKVPTWAIFGFFKALFELLETVQPDGMIVTFDAGKTTFRNEIYPAYKAHREAMPDALPPQMDAIRQGVERLGIPIFEQPNYEADDLIGTLAHQAAGQGIRVVILTGDQDAFQLIDPKGLISLLVPSFKGGLTVYDRQKVFEKWGVYPEQVADFKGLKGDTSDNIPGVPGIGDKTAAKLLAEHQTLEAVLAHVDGMKAGKLKESLITYRDQAMLSKQLATIDLQAPVTFSQQASQLEVHDLQAFKDFLATYEFRSFLAQFDTLMKPFRVMEGLEDESTVAPTLLTLSAPIASEEDLDATPETSTEPPTESYPALAMINDQVPYRVVQSLDELEAIVTKLRQCGVFAFDYETSGLNPRTNQVAGVSLSWSPEISVQARPVVNRLGLKHYPSTLPQLVVPSGELKSIESVYVPITHPELDRCLPLNEVFDRLGPLLADPSVMKIAHNAKFEINQTRAIHHLMAGLPFDTMVASYVHQPSAKHNLKALCYDVLGHPMQEITTLIGKGKQQIPFTQVPLDEAARYAAADAFVTLTLAQHFINALDADKQALLYELELPLVHVLAEMEWQGVSLDEGYLKQLSQQIQVQLDEVEQTIYQLAGCTFNLNSPKQVSEVLFDKLNIPAKGKTKTGFSTNAKILETLAPDYPIVQELLSYRQLFKLKSTYVDVLPAMVDETDHRLHTSFNQTITATGRLSSSDPNMQNIPIRSELGRSIRRAFVPADRQQGCILSADYSQIELRLLAHFSEDPQLVEAFCQGLDIHAATAALVFGVPLDAVTKEMRYRAKAVNFGIIYGQTPFGLSQTLGIPPKEAASFIETYFATYPKVKTYIESVIEEAHATGVAKTLFGRVRDLSADLNNKTKYIREFAERAAFNTPLQGSAADIMKVAMIRAYDALIRSDYQSKLILQVHDELVVEVAHGEKAAMETLVREAMGLDQPLKVPLVVDVSTGPTWMEVD